MANVAAVAAVQQQSIPPTQVAMPGMAAHGLPLMMGAAAQPVPAPAQPTQQPVMVSGKPVDGASLSVRPANPAAHPTRRAFTGVADWAAYTAPDGRNYYYNAKTVPPDSRPRGCGWV